MQSIKEALLYVWLQQAIGIASRLGREILPRFKSITEVYHCDDFSFLGAEREKYIKRLESKDTSNAFESVKHCEAIGARVIGYYDEYYPAMLRNIDSPPAALYAIGLQRDLNAIPKIAIVGTRKMSDYGKNVAEGFAYDFAKSGACVVSGLAKGVDTAAHRGAISARGFTVAVLGTPIGTIYPQENEKAFQVLYERGLVMSEMYPGCPKTRADFPNRNRIISGMSDAVVVAEAGEGSGSLITAHHAISQGKAVYAVPGTIGAENAGTNGLIKSGVPAATSSSDILAPLALEYPTKIRILEYSAMPRLDYSPQSEIPPEPNPKPKPNPKPNPKPESVPEKASIPKENSTAAPEGETVSDAIKRLLYSSERPLSADELCAKSGFSISDIFAELTMLEISGEIVASIGGRFSPAKP